MRVSFWVPSTPVPQPRQRHRIASGPGGKQWVRNYTPKNSAVTDYKAAVQLAAAHAYDGPPMAGPLAVRLSFLLPRPQVMIWKRKPMPRCPHAKRPDIDNFVKSTMDALNRRLWRDDAQVSVLRAHKWIAAGHEQPGTRIIISELEY